MISRVGVAKTRLRSMVIYVPGGPLPWQVPCRDRSPSRRQQQLIVQRHITSNRGHSQDEHTVEWFFVTTLLCYFLGIGKSIIIGTLVLLLHLGHQFLDSLNLGLIQSVPIQ